VHPTPMVKPPALRSPKGNSTLNGKPMLAPSLEKKIGRENNGVEADSISAKSEGGAFSVNSVGAGSASESVIRITRINEVGPRLHLPSPYSGLQGSIAGGGPVEAAVVVILMMVQDGDKDLQAQMAAAYAIMSVKQTVRNMLKELDKEIADAGKKEAPATMFEPTVVPIVTKVKP